MGFFQTPALLNFPSLTLTNRIVIFNLSLVIAVLLVCISANSQSTCAYKALSLSFTI